MSNDPLRGEAYPQSMLPELRDLLAVADHRLAALRGHGAPEAIAHMEDLRNRTGALIKRIEATVRKR